MRYLLKKNYNMINSVKKVFSAILNIIITNNNCIITVTDLFGNTLFWESAGTSGFKGAKKKSPFVIQTIINNVVKKSENFKIKNIEINIKGEGSSRLLALQTLSTSQFNIISINDKNTIPHNGCRAPKKRRI